MPQRHPNPGHLDHAGEIHRDADRGRHLLLEVAKVVKGLMLRDVDRGLSTGERKMLHSAKQILISELVLSQNTSYEDVEARINTALA